jgi:uncharacterized membrane protein
VFALLALSFAVHVAAAALWTGAVLYAAYAVLPAARAGDYGPAAFESAVDGLLRVTRWTGLALPLTGVYQAWRLYPLDALLGTTRGHLVLAMALLWTVMNGVVEAGAYRMRTHGGASVGVGEYVAEGFVLPGGTDDAGAVARLAAVGRPYEFAAAGLAVLLLVDAALLAGGLPV